MYETDTVCPHLTLISNREGLVREKDRVEDVRRGTSARSYVTRSREIGTSCLFQAKREAMNLNEFGGF